MPTISTQKVDAMIKTTEKTIDPIRRSIFRKFPIVFTLLVTFGVAATFFSIERILTTIPLFNNHPWYTLLLGLFILIFTGKLYAKLG